MKVVNSLLTCCPQARWHGSKGYTRTAVHPLGPGPSPQASSRLHGSAHHTRV